MICGSLVPPYLAISYTWFGSAHLDGGRPHVASAERVPMLSNQITVDDKVVAVTRNLGDAIRYVVSKEWYSRPKTMGIRRSLRIWCDYLCIDQANSVEKGQQVQNMTRIFGNATKVMAWLGVPSIEEEAQYAMALVSRVRATYRERVAESVPWVTRVYRNHPEFWPSHSEWSAKAVSLLGASSTRRRRRS